MNDISLKLTTRCLFFLAVIILFFAILGILSATVVQAADRDWDQSLRKAGIIVQPVGWYRLKFRENPDFFDNQAMTKASSGNRLVGIHVKITNKNRNHYYFATRNKVARFSDGNTRYPTLRLPFGYDLGLNCNGDVSQKIEGRETIDCTYMVELPWSVEEIRMSIPYPKGKSRGYWTLDVTNKNSSKYLGFRQRAFKAGFSDHQTGDGVLLVPVAWDELTNNEILRLPRSSRPRGGMTAYYIYFFASSRDETIYLNASDFRAYSYDWRRMSILAPTGIDCPVYYWDDDLAFCSVLFFGPKNLETLQVYYDFGFRWPDGYWRLKLDRDADNYLDAGVSAPRPAPEPYDPGI